MPNFGAHSTGEMAKLHHDLAIVASRVIEIYDFSVHQTARTIEEQIRNIRRGVSKTIDSRHIPRDDDGNYDPRARAIAGDFIPYQRGVNPWPQDDDSPVVRQKKAHRFYYLQGLFRMAAEVEGIEIRQGIDWDRDGDFFDQRFDDLPHIELHRRDWPRLRLPDDLLRLANDALASAPGGPLGPYRNP